MDKRTFIKTGMVAGLGAFMTGASCATGSNEVSAMILTDKFIDDAGMYVLPELSYPVDALEPVIDKQTIELHHSKHHAGYVKGANNAVSKVTDAINNDDFALIKHWERELAFHGAGHFLHTLYWNSMAAETTQRSSQLDEYLTKSFGSYQKFENYFTAATKAVEGSGWGVLAYQLQTDKLVILQAEKHQNQSQWISIPILVCDVWEHAYYLNYQNKRAEYIKQFMSIVNWQKVSERLANIKQFYK